MDIDRGQGLNNAIQDAANYVQAMKKIRSGENSQEIIDAYDKETLERGKREVALSLAQTDASHKVKVFKESPLAKIGIKPQTVS
jgi:2-polyprenyl-6-methoxyphenol hydroxylase-like FAD-dependent oxidoreductase